MQASPLTRIKNAPVVLAGALSYRMIRSGGLLPFGADGEQLARAASEDLREVEGIGVARHRLERAGHGRADLVGVDVRSARQPVGVEVHLLVAHLRVVEVPPAPPPRRVIGRAQVWRLERAAG